MSKILSIGVEKSQVRVAVAEQGKKRIRLVSCFWFPTPQGAVEDGYIRDTHTLGEALKNQLKSRKIKVKKAWYSISSSRVASREVRIPYVKENRIESVIQVNATDYFPVDISKYVLSYNVMNIEVTGEGKEAEKQYHMMVYAAPKSLSACYRELSEQAGLVVQGMDYQGNSVYQAMKSEESDGVHMVMKVEEQNTLISIFQGKNLSLQRSLSYGVDGAVNAVRSEPVFGTDLSYEDAFETLHSQKCIRKRLDAEENYREPEDVNEQVLEARREATEALRYLVGNITRIMDYYQSRNQNVEFSRISLCGMGGEILGLDDLLSEEIGQSVDLIQETPGIVLKDGFSKEEGSLGLYLAVAGALIKPANLLEASAKKQKAENDHLTGSIIVLGVGVIAAAALAASSIGIRIYQQMEQKSLESKIQAESSIEEVYNNYMAQTMRYSEFLQMYSLTETPNEGLVEFIEELEEKMPADISVTRFNSTNTQVSMSMTMGGKDEAARTLMQLRSFESLSGVTTTGLTGVDSENGGRVTMDVVCTYANAAVDMTAAQY